MTLTEFRRVRLAFEAVGLTPPKLGESFEDTIARYPEIDKDDLVRLVNYSIKHSLEWLELNKEFGMSIEDVRGVFED